MRNYSLTFVYHFYIYNFYTRLADTQCPQAAQHKQAKRAYYIYIASESRY